MLDALARIVLLGRHKDVTMPPLDDMPPFLGPSPTDAGLRASLRAQVTETLSTLREVVLMPRDLVPVVPRELEHEDDVVVLVHGFFASAGVWRPMKRTLVEKTGAKVASFTHAPGVGIDRIARSLAKIVERVPAGCRVHLVGHSLGGLVVRWYVQELGGHARVTQTISLGSPFGGTARAHPFPFLVGRELGRTSPLLARLRARAHEHDVPHTSVVGEGDLVVVPAESAVFPRGDVVVLPRCGHNTLLFHDDSIARVVERVRLVQADARRQRLG
ncbi:MAG: alpha/beta fold hydrolase [Labilithrix sp.]|nr:alpha/beta fold hydrolase [Labilithrix sp.]MCW5838124.1 alpha/beta fold hydrolase [Labilithrix sp.]